MNLLGPFVRKLVSTPHRDITHVPYEQWFALYVAAMQEHQEHGRAFPHKNELTSIKEGLNEMMLSSLFAKTWKDVAMPSESSSTEEESGRKVSGWRTLPRVTFAPEAGRLGHRYEVFTAAFLAEPLMGTQMMDLCMDELRRNSVNQNFESAKEESSGHSGTSAPLMHIVLPFSSLWEIKREAQLRSSAVGLSAVESPLSLQERGARRVLLQSIHNVLQVQKGLLECPASHCEAPSNEMPADEFDLRVCVWAPIDEFDALCRLPALRKMNALVLPGTAYGERPVTHMSVSTVCQQLPARLAYLARFGALKCSSRVHNEHDANLMGPPDLRLVAHATEQRRFREMGVTSVRDTSAVKKWLAAKRHSRSQSTAAHMKGANMSAHSKAVKECVAAVRRMTVREENLRQSFSQR